ncbi:2-hydroxyacid dehydrogenase [Paenibacillus tengchongensis]|uniref:2-hydroxyacid dehydrogenase n=1 Tax=Paenibacillus tengchongensis TaxID=2608684 RepID=UPI0016526BC4|nr:2-hydroxyacid dehydrogenase [Paenibacillus tengchongensis]
MERETIIYFDKMTQEMEDMLQLHKPENYDLLFWSNLDERSRQQALEEASYLMATVYEIDKRIIEGAKRTRLIQKCGVGLDNIDVTAASRRGIPVSNIPGCNAVCVAELTLLLILALYRKLPYANTHTKKGEWLTWKLRPDSYEMRGKTHGVIGMGHVGWETAVRSKAMGTEIVYYSFNPLTPEREAAIGARYLPLEELLKVSDIVSLHIPLTSDTKALINSRTLSLMKPNAVLINVARGGIIDEGDLYNALVQGTIKGAALDVFEQEPVNPQHPLLTLEQVIATPHIGGGTVDTLNYVYQSAYENIERVQQGQHPLFACNTLATV